MNAYALVSPPAEAATGPAKYNTGQWTQGLTGMWFCLGPLKCKKQALPGFPQATSAWMGGRMHMKAGADGRFEL